MIAGTSKRELIESLYWLSDVVAIVDVNSRILICDCFIIISYSVVVTVVFLLPVLKKTKVYDKTLHENNTIMPYYSFLLTMVYVDTTPTSSII